VRFAKCERRENNIYHIDNQMKHENLDVKVDKCVRDDDGNLALDDKTKRDVWKQCYKKVLNMDFPWVPNLLTAAQPVEGVCVHISEKKEQENSFNRVPKQVFWWMIRKTEGAPVC